MESSNMQEMYGWHRMLKLYCHNSFFNTYALKIPDKSTVDHVTDYINNFIKKYKQALGVGALTLGVGIYGYMSWK